jgi:hypothetical protein
MKAIRVNKFLMPVLVVLTLLGSVWVAKAAGLWQTSGRGQVLLDDSGQPDPAGIKGWMTLDDLSETYGAPLEDLYVMIGAGPDLPSGTALKELEAVVPGFEVSAVRAGVAAYLDGSWASSDGPLPEPEVTVTPQPEALPTTSEDHVPQGPGAGSGAGSGGEIVLPADGSPWPGSEIRGRMTLQEVVDLCQVPLEVLAAELGLPEDIDAQLRMRDLADQMGIEVLTVREVVDRYQANR